MEVQNKNIVKKRDTILVIFLFWLISYGIILIIWLNAVGLRLSPGKPLSIFGEVLLLYSPFYILPFILTPRLKEKKYSLFIWPIILYILIFIPLGLFSRSYYCMTGLFDPAAASCDIVTPIWYWPVIIQILFCLILSSIYYFKKEDLFSKIIKVCLVFIIVIAIYTVFFIIRSYQLPKIIDGLTTKALQSKDISFCEKIKDEGEKRKTIIWSGYRNCVETLAVELGDNSLCVNMLKYDKRNCMEAQFEKGLAHSSWASCVDMVKAAETNCTQKVLLKTSDLCPGVTGGEEKKKCIVEIAIANNDIELCKKLGTSSSGYDCISSLVLKNNNPSLCIGEGLNDEFQFYPKTVFPEWSPQDCFKYLFRKTNDSGICEKLSLQREGDILEAFCLEGAAIQLNNPELCERIPSGLDSRCLEQFKK